MTVQTGRFVLTTSPAAAPACCFICNSTNRKLFIDLGFSMEYYGAVYMCVDQCLREFATLAGFLPPSETFSLKENYSFLQRKYDAALDHCLALEDLVAAFQCAGYSANQSGVTVFYNEGVGGLESLTGDKVRQRESILSDPHSRAESSDSGPDKPLHVEGSNGLSADDDDANPADFFRF